MKINANFAKIKLQHMQPFLFIALPILMILYGTALVELIRETNGQASLLHFLYSLLETSYTAVYGIPGIFLLSLVYSERISSSSWLLLSRFPSRKNQRIQNLFFCILLTFCFLGSVLLLAWLMGLFTLTHDLSWNAMEIQSFRQEQKIEVHIAFFLWGHVMARVGLYFLYLLLFSVIYLLLFERTQNRRVTFVGCFVFLLFQALSLQFSQHFPLFQILGVQRKLTLYMDGYWNRQLPITLLETGLVLICLIVLYVRRGRRSEKQKAS